MSASRQTARDPGYALSSGQLQVLGWREARHTTLYVSGSLQRAKADTALALFGQRRKEWYVAVKAGATLRKFAVHGFAPYARIGFERNWSSITLYDYRRFTSEFGVTRAF